MLRSRQTGTESATSCASQNTEHCRTKRRQAFHSTKPSHWLHSNHPI